MIVVVAALRWPTIQKTFSAVSVDPSTLGLLMGGASALVFVCIFAAPLVETVGKQPVHS